MDQEIASAIIRVLFHQKAPAHIRIINAKRNAKGAISAIMHPSTTPEMDLPCHNIIITAARTVHNGVVDVEDTESLIWLNIHKVPLTRYMGKRTDGLQNMCEDFDVEIEGLLISTQVRWLANHQTSRERRKNKAISVIGRFRHNGEQGSTELSQERDQGSRGVIPSQHVHQYGT